MNKAMEIPLFRMRIGLSGYNIALLVVIARSKYQRCDNQYVYSVLLRQPRSNG